MTISVIRYEYTKEPPSIDGTYQEFEVTRSGHDGEDIEKTLIGTTPTDQFGRSFLTCSRQLANNPHVRLELIAEREV